MARNKTHAGITGWVCSFLGAAPTGSQQRAAATNGPKQGPAFLLLVGQHRGQVGGQLCEEGWPEGVRRSGPREHQGMLLRRRAILFESRLQRSVFIFVEVDCTLTVCAVFCKISIKMWEMRERRGARGRGRRGGGVGMEHSQ